MKNLTENQKERILERLSDLLIICNAETHEKSFNNIFEIAMEKASSEKSDITGKEIADYYFSKYAIMNFLKDVQEIYGETETTQEEMERLRTELKDL